MMWPELKRALGFSTDAEKAVWKAARERHPDKTIGWTTVVADEPGRVVIEVTFDLAPGRTYTFDKVTGVVTEC